MKLLFKNSFFVTFLLLTPLVNMNSFPQKPGKTVVQGIVTDALTGDPIPFASVIFKGTTVGTLTDNSGKYYLDTNLPATIISFSFLGYQPESRTITAGVSQTLNISLRINSISLDEVIIKPARQNYKNKNNPAVELIDNVIRNKERNRQEAYNFLQYKKYEKVQFALSNISEKFKQHNPFEKFSFIFDNIDTTKRVGNNILPVFIKESLSSHYYRKDPEANKDVILAEKSINLDEYLNNKGAAAYLNYLYQNINIYDNEILFLTNKFLSPIAVTAPAFYRYYIIDTLSVDNINCIRLFFEPRNKADFLFLGNLYITMDSSYAVRKIDMGINRDINIDWVQNIAITQDFEKYGENGWLLSKDEISIDFGIVKNSLGLFGERTISYKDYKINEPVSQKIFKGPEKTEEINPAANNEEFWDSHRSVPLTKSEKRIYTTIDSLRQIPAFRRRMDLAILLTAGVLNLGKIEIEPFGSFYSYNPVEGSRLRFGGRTTTGFSKKITLDGYVAYGSNDKDFKYNAGIIYSLTPRTIYQFPVKSISVSYQKDIIIPGQELQFYQNDDIFLSFKRGVNDKMLLNNTFQIEYLNEFNNHFSFTAGFSFTRQLPVGNLYFNTDEYGASTGKISYINISEPYLNLRYAPNESFYQGKIYRTSFSSKYPVIQLKIAGGSKSIYNDFDYMRFQMNISRRYYISILGYTDISIEAGKILGKVPYPLLFIHRANQTYAYDRDSYNLMNFLEFVSDRYVSLNVDHSFNGFILNKIPLIKKLKLREVVTCKVLCGRLSNSNNPDFQIDLFKFPTSSQGVPLTYTLENKPYIEGSVGLSNILRIFRVDLIKRFTYLDNPNISETGIRVQFRLDI